MGVVVLIGFSCAGKSRILEPLREHLASKSLPMPAEVDTDEKITEHDYPDGGIYSIFLDKAVADNTQPAMEYIVRREKEVLTELMDIKPPAIVAAGPLILQRQPEWGEFLAKHKPRIVWLRLNPGRTVAGLKDREGRYREKLFNGKAAAEHPSFGGWNKDILNTYDQEEKRWKPMLDNKQVEAATGYMKYFGETYYEKAAHETIDMNQVQPGNNQHQKLLETITEALYDN
jgi:shikimate kinase